MKNLVVVICCYMVLFNAQISYGAFGANTAWQVQSGATAANVNGAGFDWGNAHFDNTLTCTGATGTTPSCTATGYSFITGDVTPAIGAGTSGAWLFIQSGTNWYNNYGGNSATAGNGCWYPITSASGSAAIINAAIGAAICVDLTTNSPNPQFRVSIRAGISSVSTPTAGVWGLDYSQGDAAPFTGTDATSTIGTTNPATLTLNTPTATIGLNWIGNSIHITAGTNFTQEWYECVQESTATCTLDKALGSSASLSGGTYHMGGAVPLGSTTTNQTDTIFVNGTHVSAGNRFFIASAQTVGQTITTASGSTLSTSIMEGFQSKRGDAPTGSNRPVLNISTFTLTMGNFWQIYNLSFTGTGAGNVLSLGTNSVLSNSKVVNTSVSTNRVAVSAALNDMFYGIEAISYRGYAIFSSGGSFQMIGSYIHDSSVCFQFQTTTSGLLALNGNIIENCAVAAVQQAILTSNAWLFNGNTFNNGYGASPNKTGTGIILITGSYGLRLTNNIFTGFSTAVSDPDIQNDTYDNFNNYYNNTTDVSGWAKGPNDVSLDPQFSSVQQVNGTTATSATNVLTDSGANFSNVVNNQDFCFLISGTGTGFAAQQMLITGHTTTTLTLSSNITSSGAGTAISYQVTTGHNYGIGANLKGIGFPGIFPTALSTGYLSIGGVVPQNSAAGGQVGYAQ